MIRINLRSSSSRDAASKNRFIAGGGQDVSPKDVLLKLVFLIAGPIGLYYYESTTLPVKVQELARIQAQIVDTQEFNGKKARAVEEIKRFAEEQDQIKKKIKLIEDISRVRLHEIKTIDIVQQVTPEKVWLVEMNIEDEKFMIKGNSITDTDITAFLDSLAKNTAFADVSLQSANDASDSESKQVYKNFEITGKIEKEKTQ